MPRRGVFPGSFDPLTVAHLAIADAARSQCELGELHLVISTVALAKEDRRQAPIESRIEAILRHRGPRPWLRAAPTTAQLLADIAADYDVLVLGADKWFQLHDPSFYGGSTAARDEALARLPTLAVAPRGGFALPSTAEIVRLDLGDEHAEVSSTAVRRGHRPDWQA